jgi:hypothetical protein
MMRVLPTSRGILRFVSEPIFVGHPQQRGVHMTVAVEYSPRHYLFGFVIYYDDGWPPSHEDVFWSQFLPEHAEDKLYWIGATRDDVHRAFRGDV